MGSVLSNTRDEDRDFLSQSVRNTVLAFWGKFFELDRPNRVYYPKQSYEHGITEELVDLILEGFSL